MAQAPESNKDNPSLPDRAAKYRQEIDRVVREVGEHPLYELKRSCSFSVLKDRIEFVKDFQSIASSRIDTEKFLVIGADDAAHSFYPVQNVSEFDEAAVRQLLERYLVPVPEFEVFHLTSSDGHQFVLFVIPKQKRRRILARVTVDDSSEMRPRVLLREGDLWTKGGSTGKRLAKPEDWDEIYEEVIEAEAEQRTRQRTAHSLDLALARERVRTTASSHSLPSYFTDDEFQALMEELCSNENASKFKLLLERLRDDAVEAWHDIGAYDSIPMALSKKKIEEHIRNVFRPSMHWLTLAGIYVVKNSGPLLFLDLVTALLKEVFDTTHRLRMLRVAPLSSATVDNPEHHVSHTVPALESLVALHLLGAYVLKRSRLQYLRSLIRPVVYRVAVYPADLMKNVMAFWPLGIGQGEPNELQFRSGRIDFCVRRVNGDLALRKLFGSTAAALAALCQYEFCLELNSNLAVSNNEAAANVARAHPDVQFYFRPSFIAFPLEHIYELAESIYSEIRMAKPELLKLIVFELVWANMLTAPTTGAPIFLEFLAGIARDQAALYMEQRRFPPMNFWPQDIQVALKEYARKK
ncbi:MAG: hypothetical protein WB536_16890 [Terriglobales bacterium]